MSSQSEERRYSVSEEINELIEYAKRRNFRAEFVINGSSEEVKLTAVFYRHDDKVAFVYEKSGGSYEDLPILLDDLREFMLYMIGE